MRASYVGKAHAQIMQHWAPKFTEFNAVFRRHDAVNDFASFPPWLPNSPIFSPPETTYLPAGPSIADQCKIVLCIGVCVCLYNVCSSFERFSVSARRLSNKQSRGVIKRKTRKRKFCTIVRRAIDTEKGEGA